MSGSGAETARLGTDVPFRGLITVCLMIACLMQALDTTIANVALPYMQGSVSASYDQITWVLTSYVIAAAIFTAPTSWWWRSRRPMRWRSNRRRRDKPVSTGYTCS